MRAYPRMARVFLLGLPLLLVACVGDGERGTGPNGEEELSGSPPATPSITQLVPIVQEPDRGMHLTIRDASDNEDGFRIERKVGGGSFNSLTSLSPNTDNYTDWGLEMSTQYTYRIQAYNKDGNSNWSEKTQTASGPEPGTVFLNPTADAFVIEADPDINFGIWDRLLVTRGSLGREYSYIKFPYAEISSYIKDINLAELRLITRNPSIATLALVYVEDLASDWEEYGVTWNNRPINRGITTDNAYVSFDENQPVYWNITPIVKNWFEGITLNRGIRLFSVTDNEIVGFWSREANQKPLLTVDYTW